MVYGVHIEQNTRYQVERSQTKNPKPLTTKNMKKSLLPLLFLLLTLPAMSQMFLSVTGTVTDTATGNPIPNHAVNIYTDSTSGWGYYNTLYTDMNGQFVDTIIVQNGVSQGYLYVSTLDCQNYPHTLSFAYDPLQYSFTAVFSICYSNNPCQPGFTSQLLPALTVQFTDLSIGGGGVRYWLFGDGNTSNEQNPVHQYSQPGYYGVTLIIGALGTTCYDSAMQYIYVSDSTGGGCQAAFIAIPDSMNTSNTYQFFDQSTGNNFQWYWNFGDPASGSMNTATSQNPLHTFSAAGSYNVCLTIFSSDSTCYDVTCQTITIGNTPGCQADFTYSFDSLQGGNQVYFTDLSTGIPNAWHWDFGDGATSDERFPIHTYLLQGTYTVCLTISGDSCADTHCSTVSITDTTIYHQVYGQVFAGNFPITAGSMMIYSADTNATTLPYMEVTTIDSLGIYYFTLVPEGSYYLIATPSDATGYLPTYYGNVIDWQSATILLLGEPNNPYNISLAGSGQLTPGPGSTTGLIKVSGLKSSMVDKINVILKDEPGNPIGFAPVASWGEFIFPSMAYGTYYLYPELANVTSDHIKVVLTEEEPAAVVNMTFTGSRILGIDDQNVLVTSWVVYPNPFTDLATITIDLHQSTHATVEIYNLTGQLKYRNHVALSTGSNTITCPLSDLSPGIFTLRILSSDGLNLNAKLIKIK